MLMTSTADPKRGSTNPLPQESTAFDWDGVLSLDLIRQHTKTDDVPGVTDAQLALYRRAAIEAAELYTGQLLTGQRTVTEPVSRKAGCRPKMVNRHRLRYPSADGTVHLYGSRYGADNRTLHIQPGTRTIEVPTITGIVDTSNCCDPCAVQELNGGMMAAYKAGFASCPDGVPAGILLGILQYLAWIVEHPGDEYLTVRNREDNSNKGVVGTNNIAFASGALDTWRQYDPEAY